MLVAEDNPVNQLVIETLLRRRGFAVDVVADGLEAVQRLDPERHDAVFMDCQMPNLDGYEATARIRAGEPPGRHIPIVAMTAHAFAEDRERCLRAGMDDYLSKPIRGEDLDPVLERWLGTAAPPADGVIDGAQVDRLHSASPGMRRAAHGGVRAHDAAAAGRAARRGRARRGRRAAQARAPAAREQRRGRRPAPLRARLAARARRRRRRAPSRSSSRSIATRSSSSSDGTDAAVAELEPVYRETLEQLQRAAPLTTNAPP